MSGTFGARLAEFKKTLGKGAVEGTVEVNQVYAHYQHEHPEFHHPDGGSAFYLRDPLFQKGPKDYMAALAEKAITADGCHVNDAMKDNMEDLSLEVYVRAPWEFADLRASGHPKVTQGGATIFDRAPNCGRLSEADLKAKSHLRYLFDPHRYSR